MSHFRFLHAADLHLGSPFSGLAIKDREIAERFARATRAAFSELVTQAIAAEVAFAVIAGDIYDGEWRDNSIGLFFNREIARLDRAGIPVFLLKGNHDAESVVTKSISMPESVRHFDTRKPSSVLIDELKVALHGQSFAERAANENLGLSYPAPVPGYFNIGVLHTSLTGRPPHANYAPCTVDDLRSRGYDYWALGHVHDFEIVAEHPHIVFPGNLQGRNIRETGAKGAVIVTVEDARVAGIERIFVDQARFVVVDIDATGFRRMLELLHEAERSLARIATDSGDMLHAVRVRLVGQTPLRRELLAGRTVLGEEIQAACHRVHSEFWLEKLVLDISDPQTASPPGEELVEFAAAIDAVLADPAVLEAAESTIEEIRAKMPLGRSDTQELFGETLETLLAEAREVALSRASEGHER